MLKSINADIYSMGILRNWKTFTIFLIILGNITLFFQNCGGIGQGLQITMPTSRITPPPLPTPHDSNSPQTLTVFDNTCTKWVTGLDSQGVPIWGSGSSGCNSQTLSKPLLLSISHENNQHTHAGDANFNQYNLYMSDYRLEQKGSWFNFDWWTGNPNEPGTIANLVLDTINFNNPPVINITGRDIRNGYLFMGINDLTTSPHTLDKNIVIQLTVKVKGKDLDPAQWAENRSGHRMMLGASINWSEPGRANTSHFVEFNLLNSDNFFTVQDRASCPTDFNYVQCWYDPNGMYSEGKYFDVASVQSTSRISQANETWVTYQIPLSQFVKNYYWHFPPFNWANAQATFYIGIESQGASRLWVQIKDYKIIKN